MAESSCSVTSVNVRSALRKKIGSSSGIYEVERLVRKKYPSLEVSMISIESAPNQLSQLLTVSRSIKSYCKCTGPLDSVKIVFDCEQHYVVYLFCECFAEGNLSSPKDVESLEVLAAA